MSNPSNPSGPEHHPATEETNTMNISELAQELAQHDQDRYVVLRNPESGFIYSLQFLIQETAVWHGNQDLRCGPHNLTYKPSDKDRTILHFGQQGWYGKYPPTPDVETVGKLARELDSFDQDLTLVLTHHFDDFVDVNLILPIDDTGSPMLWGNPGSNVSAWPRETRKAPPDRVLLIGNTENEAYSQLRKAARAERDARTYLLQADRPGLQGQEDLIIGSRTVTRTKIRKQHRKAEDNLKQAWAALADAIRKG